jgi:signal transduction histidine kinase
MSFTESSGLNDVNQVFALLLAQAAADALIRARGYDEERVARRGAEMLARARADVLGIVAHDLRNPLSVVGGSGAFMLDSEEMPPAQRRKMLEMIQRAAGR